MRLRWTRCWLGLLIVVVPFSALATKLNPVLRLQRGLRRRIAAAAGPSAPPPSFRVLIELRPGTAVGDLRAAYPTARFRTAAGPIVTATIPDPVLDALESDPRVVRVEAARRLHPMLDVVRSNQASGGLFLGVTRNAASADLANANGGGVIVGIVDTGIDYHHADFKSGGASRILFLWDQTDAGGPAPSFNGFSCTNAGGEDDCASTEWTQVQLTAGTAREVDTAGHGTHVAGIAAGNGQAGSAPGTYAGLAPRANIIFVKTDFSNDGIIDGVKYIADRAALLGMPAVVNLSLGGQIDPHDGTSPFDKAIAAIAANTPVVAAMGNDGTGVAGTFPHAQIPALGASQSVTLNAVAAAGRKAASVDLWTGGAGGANNSAYTVSVAINGHACGTKVDGAGTDAAPLSCSVGGATYQVTIDNDDSFVGQAGGDTTISGDREIYVEVDDASGFPATLPFSVALTCASAACGQLDGFVDPEGQGVNFTAGAGYATPSTLTMSSPATADNVFAVGSYAAKTQWSPGDGFTYRYDNSSLGGLSVFSGQGPTRDGRQKPDVAAPGDVIASSLSGQAAICSGCTFDRDPGVFNQVLSDGAHAILAGTSMATPVVTGILATRLQAAPSRSVAQLRAILQGLARTDAQTGSAPNSGWGYGKVVASPQPVSPPSGVAATSLGISSIAWSWNAATLSADAYDLFYATNAASSVALAVQPPFNLTGLLPNATYSLLIEGEGAGIDGPGATITTATYAAAPAGAPTATPLSTSANLAYPACAAGACSGYAVEASTAADFSGVLFSSASLNPAAIPLQLSGLSANTRYFMRLGNLNPYGAPTYGPSGSFTTTGILAAPSSPSFDQISTGTIRFGWAAGGNPAGTVYSAQASTSEDFSGTILTQTGTPLDAVYSGLSADTSYYFRVQAVGGPPLAVPAPTATLAAPPAVSTNTFPAVGSASFTVAWSSGGDQADTLFRADISPSPTFASGVVSALVRTTAAEFSGLAPNTLYYARAAAISRSGTLSASVVLGSTATLAAAPSSSATVTSGGAVLAVSAAFPQLRQIRVTVPFGAFPEGTSVSATANQAALPAANSSEARSLTPLGPAVGVDLEAGGLQPSAPVAIAFSYDPAQIPAGQREQTLQLMRYDVPSAQWTFVPSQVDAAAHVLTGFAQHFSLFAPFFVAAASDLGAVQVFPQPWEIGDPASRYWSSSLTFSNLPAGARVRLFTVAGEEIFDGSASAGGVLAWDGLTRFGRKAASGTYFAAIESGGTRFVRRVVIIR